MTENPVVLDLCGGTGSWSKPYREAGYDVRLITLPEQDVRTYHWKGAPVRGVLAAPPCTMFSMANPKVKRTPSQLLEALLIVAACLRVISESHPKWWALENPRGMLSKFMGTPTMVFQPWQYGDPWTKMTLLWGRFLPLRKRPVYPRYYQTFSGTAKRLAARNGREFMPEPKRKDRATFRAITPPGFARAFFEANP